jgi:hypothetical protein
MGDATPIIRQQIVGMDLSAVTFVRDYVQLDFDGPKFNVLTPITVASSSNCAISGGDPFRNRLCDQIGKVVSDVTYEEHKSFLIALADGTTISFSLRKEDYPGPEAVEFFGSGGLWVVI